MDDTAYMKKNNFFFTVDVEEWFASTKILSLDKNAVYENSSDTVETMTWLIHLLNKYNIRGTFFFITTIAKRHPELVHMLLEKGHEIALHGMTHEHLNHVTSDAFASMVRQAQQLFQQRFGITLYGYRAPYFSINEQALRVLKTAHFLYDSSVVPSLRIPGWYGVPRAPRVPYKIGNTLESESAQSTFTEFPLSVHPTFRLPGLGGYYFRNLGFFWTRHLLNICMEQLGYAIFYLHPWELSLTIPKLRGMPFYMHRKTGAWTREALESLLKMMKHSSNGETIPLSAYCKSHAQ